MKLKQLYIIHFTLYIALTLSFCALAQEKSGSAEATYTLRSTVGLPAVGKVGDGAKTILSGLGFAQPSAELAKQPVESQRPLVFGINSIAPNPFNPTCVVEFETAEENDVKLEIFDISGRLAATPLNEELQPGRYELTFDGADKPTGVYLFRLSQGGKSVTKRVVYLK